ncbi:Ankyrin repeat, SAM and basic leucine zipper domain-containing protein 1 [Halotydeus destructor]|nr:Ankyrin repeat, SAM and basic leucine zipper domain-containing protein 1 [Halotydeus destructor]
MSFIPGGYEDEDSDDEFADLVYSHDPLKKNDTEVDGPILSVAKPTSAESAPTVTQHAATAPVEGDFDWGFVPVVQSKAFISVPNSLNVAGDDREAGRPTTPIAIVLDDIRNAIINDNVEYIELNADPANGYPVDTLLKNGWTALMYSAGQAFPELVQFFLVNGADPNFHRDMFTPLMAVCCSTNKDESKLVECAKLLLEYGAEIKKTDRFLNTPIVHATKKGKKELAQFLLDNGAGVNDSDTNGFTCLHLAAQAGRGDIVRIFLDAGAIPDLLTSDGQTAAEVAYDADHQKIGDIIEKMKTERMNSNELSESDLKALQTTGSRSPAIFNYSSAVRSTSYEAKRDPTDLEIFLNGLSLSDCIPIFENNNVTLMNLMLLEEEDLTKMGILKLGDRKRIIEAVHGITKADWRPSSLPDLKEKKNNLNAVDAVLVMSNIAKHLSYIETTVAYLRHQVKKQPLMLEKCQDIARIDRLTGNLDECLNNTHLVFDEIRFLKKDITPLTGNAEHAVPHDINENLIKLLDEKPSRRQSVFFIGAAIASTIVIAKFHHQIPFSSLFSKN